MNLRNENVVTVLMKYTYLKLYQSCNNSELFSNKFFAAVSQKKKCLQGVSLLFLHYTLEYLVWIKIQQLIFSTQAS